MRSAAFVTISTGLPSRSPSVVPMAGAVGRGGPVVLRLDPPEAATSIGRELVGGDSAILAWRNRKGCSQNLRDITDRMPHLLHLDSSADLTGSRSRAITAAFASAWSGRGDDHTITYRDLHTDPLPRLSTPTLHWAPRLRTAEETAPAGDEALQRAVLDELLAADVLLVGAPMYNYSLPSTLKSWIDYVHVPGVTTTLDEVPSQPLAGRQAVVVTSAGGSYAEGSPTRDWDHLTPVLRIILGDALGMVVTVVSTELTLAPRIPDLAPQIAHSEALFAAALDRASTLGATL